MQQKLYSKCTKYWTKVNDIPLIARKESVIRIGIDALFIRPGKVGGTESYVRNLWKALAICDKKNEYFLFANGANAPTFTVPQEHFHVVPCSIAGTNRFTRVLYVNGVLPFLAQRHALDLLLFPSYIRYFFGPSKTKTVSNIHDLQYKHYPQFFDWIQKVTFGIFYRCSIRKSDSLLCSSRFVQEDILRYFPEIHLEKLKVLSIPIDFEGENAFDSSFSKSHGLQEKNYILSVASLLPHKNLETLLKAVFHLKEKGIRKKLVLVGIQDKQTSPLQTMIQRLGLKEQVLIPGFVSNEVRNWLYAHAALYVCTSLFEGFGMPPVEALYHKIPVISTRCASLEEVTQGQATYYDNPLDEKELAQKIEKILQNPPSEEYREKCRALVYEKYNLETIAQQYITHFVSIHTSAEDATF